MKKKSKNGFNNNSELSYLTELINDFPCRRKVSPQKAEKQLISRYLQLEKKIPVLLKFLDDPSLLEKIIIPYSNFPDTNDIFPKYFYFLMYFSHEFLFSKILNNAGEFRKSSDPNGGKIGFGGSDYRIIAKFKYSGSPCNSIEYDLKDCFSLLVKNPTDPLSNSVEFYRRFVKIHPYYDGNGRIGRLIISIYNLYHGNYIKWSEIENGGNKTEFIKRLNECHKREGQLIYHRYFNYLLSFFHKFILKTSEIMEQ
ncbi:MAG: Fic family protein [Ignavibacteriaceae bacterium]